MFLKRVLMGMVVFSGAVSLSYGYAPDKIDLSFLNAETQIISCRDCPIPGKECRSYIATSTNKFCLSSGEEHEDKDAGKDNRDVVPMQSDDLVSLRESLDYPEDHNSELLQETEDDTTLEQEPITEKN